MSKSVSLVIPTYRADERIFEIVKSALASSLNMKILLVDSTNNNNIFNLINTNHHVITIKKINQKDFNHGATREFGRKLLNTDIVIFMTQDAIPVSSQVFSKLIQPILDGEAVATYGRQIPHESASVFEAYPRAFSYPRESRSKFYRKGSLTGVDLFFLSDSFSAYLNNALDEIGGFRPTLTWEDYFASARLQLKGYKVKYMAEAVVRHSHNYTLFQEFKRYFDAGYVRRQNYWLSSYIEKAEKRGGKYFLGLLREIMNQKKYFYIPYAIIQSFVKFLGYRVGYSSLKAPIWFKKICSDQNYYWGSKYYNDDEVEL